MYRNLECLFVEMHLQLCKLDVLSWNYIPESVVILSRILHWNEIKCGVHPSPADSDALLGNLAIGKNFESILVGIFRIHHS